MKNFSAFFCAATKKTAHFVLILLLTTFGFKQVLSQDCAPYSSLPCNQLQVNLPFHLTFNSPVAGTLADKNGNGTGFTLVDTYSGTRQSQDGPPSNPDIPGYEPSRLTLSGGQLNILTNKGIASNATNNQLNTLGVKVNSQQKLEIETTLLNPYNGASFEQAGLWFGLSDKTFLKLVAISGNRIEMRREFNDISNGASGTSNADQRVVGVSELNTKTVRLKLIIDPASNTAEGYYSIDGGVHFLNVGVDYSTPRISIGDMGLTQSTAFAGIFSTYRNGPAPVTYSFDDFRIQSPAQPQAPTVNLTAPADGSSFNAPASIELRADAQDADGSITKVEFFQGATLIGTATAAPYTVTWNGVAAGNYSLTAKATDNEGLSATTAPVTIVVNGTALCSASGTILREFWSNISGKTVATIPVNTIPTATTQLSSFETPANIGDNYGQRLRGYLCAPITGAYTFYIASDDNSELWLGTTDDPQTKVRISFTNNWTGQREWTKYSTQKSGSITLQAGQRYYIEALQKEGVGGDNLAVGWQTPGSSTIEVIPGSVLSPYFAVRQAPTVNLTAPADGSSFNAPASIELRADAQDADGSITKVEFFQGATLIGTATAAPYAVTWNGVAEGNYSLTAKATDDEGMSTISGVVSVSVKNAFVCTASGTILREFWSGVPGKAVSDIPINTPPTATTQLNLFETPANAGENYGQRISGYICAPITGPYIFYIASDDNSELWLSTTDNPQGKVRIASVSGWTPLRDWTKFTTQRSGTINLVEGQKYYIEALHKEGYSGDNLSVAWQTPGSSAITVIPGSVLSPFVNTNLAPTVNFVSPVNGALFSEPASIELSAEAQDADGSIAKVEFFHDNVLIGTVTSTPFSFLWNDVTPGTYTLTAKATDNTGLSASTAPISIQVNASKQAPTVSLIEPANNSSFAAPASVQLKADAKDTDGTIAKVEFFSGATLIGTITVAPFHFAWNAPSTGVYTLTARATDNDGLSATSSGVTVNVVACSGVGSIGRELWSGVSGTSVSSIPVGTTPSSTSQLTMFETPANAADNYGQRIRGYVCAPASGPYTFYIASDDHSELWLSPSDDPQARVLVASVSGWTNAKEWTKFSSQKSVTLTLQQGQRYYIEALHKEGTGGDHLAVGWLTPGASSVEVIPGSVLSPFVSTPQAPTVSLTTPVNGAFFTAPATVTLSATARDLDGSIAKVEFFQGTTLIGTATTAPYTLSWSGVSEGSYSLTAKATDNSGLATTSETVTVTVGGTLAALPRKLYDNDPIGGGSAAARTITVQNTWAGRSLTLTGITLGGTHAAEFVLSGLPSLPKTLAPGETLTVQVAFNPSTVGLKTATLNLQTSEGQQPPATVSLRGLGTAGVGGTNEPSLQAILSLLEIAVNVGDDNAATNIIHSNTTQQRAPLLGEEVSLQRFVKAQSGPVTLEPLAVFGPTANDPVVAMGWYPSGNATAATELFSLSNNPATNAQTVNVSGTGQLSFDPGTAAFGFYSRWPFFANRHLYSEDALNTFSGAIPHHVRVYPYKNAGGQTEPYTYIVAFEEHTSGFDYQDLVFVVRNVKPAPPAGSSQPPQFSAPAYTFSLADNAPLGQAAGTVVATDPDGDALSYTITGGNTNGAFALDPVSGQLTVAKVLNYHTQSRYTLLVQASDASGATDLTAVTITVSATNTTPAFSLISWGTVANQPFNVSEAQGKVVGGKLYTFGGFDSQKSGFTPTSRAYVYDPVANTWTAIAAMPPQNGTAHGGVTHAGFATDGTDIYFAGGYTANSAGTGQIFGTREVWKYIVAENRYVRLPDLPVTISAGQLEYVNGRLHHIAGTNASRTQDLDLHYVLDLDNTAAGWQSLAPLPNPRQHAGSAVYQGKIYFIAGQKGHDDMLMTQKDVHVYDPATNTWTQVADLPVPAGASGRGHISSAVVVAGEQLIVMGGETKHGTSVDLVSSYSPAANTWTTLSPLPAVRYSGVAALLGGTLYYTGGSNSRTTYRGLPGVPQVLNYTLIDADTDQPIQTLSNNTTLNIATLPTRNLNIRANTNLVNGGSVMFTLSGAETRTFTDGALPFALMHDNNGDYHPWTPTAGSYTLKTTPYTTSNATGAAGTALTINFKVVDNPQKITSFTLINADTDQPIDTFSTDRTLNLALLPTRNLNIRTNSDTATLGSVVFSLSGAESRQFTDNAAPFALFEDNRGDYYDWTPTLGVHTLAATPYAASGGSGIQGLGLTVTLTVIDQPERQVTSFTLMDADTDQPIQTLTNGTILNLALLAGKNLNIRANTQPASVGSLVFTLSGAETRTFTDNVAPYALFGDNNGDFAAWTPKAGHYTLKATPFAGSGGSGEPGPTTALVFSVTATAQPTLVSVSPIADAYVRDGSSANTNFGFDTLMNVRGTTSTGNTRRLYLKFPLNGVGNVVTAKLRLYGRNTENATTITTSVFGVEGDAWTESDLTFNNAPAGLPAALGNMSVNNQSQYYEVDVTAFIKEQLAKDKVASLLVSDAANQNRTLAFNSRENAFFKPELVITTSSVVPQSGAQLFVENLDRFPTNEDFVASRIQIPWSRDGITYNTNHDIVRVRLHNKGMSPLTISEIALSNRINWKLVSLGGVTYDGKKALPLSIASGGYSDLQIRFIPPDSLIRVRLIVDELLIASNDDQQPNKTLYLRGLYQREGEGSKEPRAQEMINAFGFKTRTGFGGSDPDRGANGKPKGDEVLSSYFVRVDPARPVTVRQMGAYHGCCGIQSETLQWFPKGSPSTLSTAASHIAVDAQVLLPRRSSSATYTPSDGSFSPNVPFGLKVGGKDWSDTLLTPGRLIGVRVWKAIDKRGEVVPNTYIVANDYLGTDVTNYDYNDNMYYLTNIRPELGPASASLLAATPRAVDFGEQWLQTTTTKTLTLQSLGQVYGAGVQDPNLHITALAISGENKAEFSATLPQKMSLSPQETTQLTVQFTPQSQGLKTADLLIYYGSTASPLRVPLHGLSKAQGTLVTVPYRVKSGSDTAVVVGGKTYRSDKGLAFDNLEPYTNRQLTRISGTEEDTLYLSEQSSNGERRPFRYELPLTNGTYWVRLHFAEIFWATPGGTLSGGTGSRVMSLTVEGELRLLNLDVTGQVGTATAYVVNLPVTVTDGKLNLNFTASANRPMIGALEVFQFNGEENNPLVQQQRTTIPERMLGKDNKKPVVYPNPLRKHFTVSFPTTYVGNINLQLADAAGRLFELGKMYLPTGGTNLTVEISRFHLSQGVYFLRITKEDGKTEIIKLLIQ